MTRRSKSAATIIDIGRQLGVSAMTVSRALTGSSEVSETTRQRVVQCAEELGYRPNRWARSLVTSRSSVIGVIVPDISHSYFAEITAGIQEVVEKAGCVMLLCHSQLDPQREKTEIDTLIGSRVDGLIIASEQPENAPESFTDLTRRNIPFVLIDRSFLEGSFPSVRVDDREVGRLATRFLIELGHKRIAFLNGGHISPASLRYQGYRDVLEEAGIPLREEWVEPGNFDIPTGHEAMKRLLKLQNRPSAVFAANDPMGIGAVHACRDAGLRVPQDISIMGAGNIEGLHHPTPFLTTIDWPRQDLGRAAADMLLARIADPTVTAQSDELLTPKLLVRQSTNRPGI